MASNSNFGYPDVKKSITNPNVKRQDALDVDYPMPFLTFIKIVSSSYEPEAIQNYYNFYIRLWNKNHAGKVVSDNTLIVNKYQEFLKEISLNYTTLEEKKFLKKIDFSDPYDLDIAIGFYSRKLKEISLKYNKKREDLKFELTRKKLKGTNFGIERNIRELILEGLDNMEDSKIILNLSKIKQDLEIEIEEFYDGYPLYYNRTPSPVYDDKDLDYGSDIFLKSNEELIENIFSGVSETIRNLKEANSLFDNKRRLTEKYISTDFYYLSTGSTTSDIVSGRIFEADKPSLNFANRNYPTTASTDRSILQSFREKGFFKPTNTSIITIDGKNSTYFFNIENLKPNSVYYFPDPSIIGDNGEIMTFIVDDSFLKRNFSTGNANNQPSSSENDTKYYGYHSQIDPNAKKYMDSLFDLGYIHDSKRDIYNNSYGLLKKNQFEDKISNQDGVLVKNLILNGHTFYDDLYGEGYNFDYNTVDNTTFKETNRSGVTTNTNGYNLSSYYTLFFRYFLPYEELIDGTENNLITTYDIIDGAFLLNSNNIPYDDSSSDKASYPGSGIFYYNDLIEGGINSSTPIQRALVDASFPSLTANLIPSFRPDEIDTFSIDGGRLGDPFDFQYSFSPKDYVYIDETSNPSSYILSSSDTSNASTRYDLPGTIYIKNTYTKEVLPVVDSLVYLTNRYNSSVIGQLSAVYKFEIANDTIFIQTKSYLIIDKIDFQSGSFVNPKTTPTYITLSGDYQKLSNRFKLKDKVYYCLTKSGPISSNNFNLYPEIYEYNLTTNKNVKIFPINISDITDFFSVSGQNVRYESVEEPTLTHSSRNNIFNTSFLLKDQNNNFYLHEYDFDISPSVKFISHNRYKPTPDQTSNTFDLTYLSNLNVFLSSSAPTVSQEEIIL